MARVVFVIGNAESRQGFDLYKLRRHGYILGCNALYRDFDPDWLVAVDKPMYSLVQAEWGGDRITLKANGKDACAVLNDEEEVPLNELYWWDSGKLATFMGWYLYPDIERIYLIGFDFWADPNRAKINNVYKGTDQYRAADKPAHYDPVWYKKWNKTLAECRGVKFYRVGPKQPHLSNLNAELIDYGEFEKSHLVDRATFYRPGRLGDDGDGDKTPQPTVPRDSCPGA